DVTAHRTVFGLVAGIGGDVATSAEVAVVGRPVVDVSVRPTPGEVTVLAPAVFGTDPEANLDAHVGARDVIESHTVQAANLHVLDELKTRGPAIFNDGGCDAAKTRPGQGQDNRNSFSLQQSALEV